MIKLLDGASESTIAIEFTDGYELKDEKKLEGMFEEKLAKGITRINFLAKIDKINLNASSWKAMWDDGMFAIKHMKNCGHIAIVGNSKLEEFLIKMDNAFFENKKADRKEKYFDVADIDNAMGWANE
ncbi:MAG: STAS/SEC14 domain-containing protein [Bacteroidota bacterium]